MAQRMAVSAQGHRQLAHQRKGVAERLQVGDLAADVHVDAGDDEARQLGSPGVEAGCGLEGHAELVLGLAGGDLGVRLASTSGFTRKATAAGFRLAATRSAPGAPARTSTLKSRMPSSSANAISSRLANAGEDDRSAATPTAARGGPRPPRPCQRRRPRRARVARTATLNWPSPRSRSAYRGRRTPLAARCSAAPASPTNSSRPASRPPRRYGRGSRPPRGGRRRHS